MLRKLMLMVGLVLLVATCGKGSPETTGKEVDEVKAVLTSLIEASLKNDLAAARDHLDVGQYLQAMGSPLAYKADMTPQQMDKEAQSCFNQLLAVKNNTKLTNSPAIEAAVRGAKVNVLSQTRHAEVLFQAPDSTRDGVVKFRCKFTQSPGGTWMMITLEMEF